MEKLMRAAASTIGRRSFFRSLGKFGMGAAAVAGVHLLSKRASAQTVAFCDNNGGACAGLPVGSACGRDANGDSIGDKTCVGTKPNANGVDFHCQCSGKV